MNLAGGDARERLLSAAWDEATTPSLVPGTTLFFRPFSTNALRRATVIGLHCLAGDFTETLSRLPPSVALGEVETLAWLLSADLDTVRGAMRRGTWARELETYELPHGALGHVRVELARVLALVQAAMFAPEEKPAPPLPVGKAPPPPPDPPANLIRPGVVATLAFTLAKEFGRPADELLEWVPVCQIFQLAHCLQWGNSQIWTVDPAHTPELAPHEIAEPEPDPGFGESIEF